MVLMEFADKNMAHENLIMGCLTVRTTLLTGVLAAVD